MAVSCPKRCAPSPRWASPLMVDAGVSSISSATAVLATGARRVVVGLETLTSLEELARIVNAVGASGVVFSLDVRGEQVLTRPDGALVGVDPITMAREALGLRDQVGARTGSRPRGRERGACGVAHRAGARGLLDRRADRRRRGARRAGHRPFGSHWMRCRPGRYRAAPARRPWLGVIRNTVCPWKLRFTSSCGRNNVASMNRHDGWIYREASGTEGENRESSRPGMSGAAAGRAKWGAQGVGWREQWWEWVSRQPRRRSAHRPCDWVW